MTSVAQAIVSPVLLFSPHNGEKDDVIYKTKYTVTVFRILWPSLPWKFNPWTGQPRTVEDIKQDPLGMLILPPR